MSTLAEVLLKHNRGRETEGGHWMGNKSRSALVLMRRAECNMTKHLPKEAGDTFACMCEAVLLLFHTCQVEGHSGEQTSHFQGKLHQQFSIKA